MKTGENCGKELKNVWMNFSPTCRQKPERQYSRTICCQHNSILQRPKKYSIHYLTGWNWVLSGQKNIWPVIMTSDLLFVILSPDVQKKVAVIQLVGKKVSIIWSAIFVVGFLLWCKMLSTSSFELIFLIFPKTTTSRK